MSNMSYCRFENTASDLRDCLKHWDDLDETSTNWEFGARREIWVMACEIADKLEPAVKEES